MGQSQSAYEALFTYTRVLSRTLGYRDSYTQLHSNRVQGLAAELGRHCGLSADEMQLLNVAAAFHDIGKVGVPDAILFKDDRLVDGEWRLMQEHPRIGENIMAALSVDGAKEVAQVIRHHHERHNGQGYPDGLAGDEIPLLSRIISIADNYDAMAETRAYHRGRPHQTVMATMKQETGDKHDPELMDVFNYMIEHSPYRALEV